MIAFPTSSRTSDGAAAAENLAATSFVSFLINSYGADTLRQFSRLRPRQGDHAALGAYHRRSARWKSCGLAGLRRPAGRTAVFRSFCAIRPLVRPYWRREVELFAYIDGLAYGSVCPLKQYLWTRLSQVGARAYWLSLWEDFPPLCSTH